MFNDLYFIYASYLKTVKASKDHLLINLNIFKILNYGSEYYNFANILSPYDL